MFNFNNNNIKSFTNKLWLSSPTMHEEELQCVHEAFDTNWVSTVGENINQLEATAAERAGVKYAVAMSSCTAALHIAVKLAAEQLYGRPIAGHGALEDKKVFCSDMTFCASVNPVIYENGMPVFVDTDAASWNMSPAALEKAFALHPDVRLVVMAHLYGFPADVEAIKKICTRHGALLIEDAAEAMGATVNGRQCGSFGDYSAISYNGNKIITGSGGGCFLTNDAGTAERARNLSTQAREQAPWYQHEEIGYNYRMSNITAGIVRGQYLHLDEHIAQKKAIYERYTEGLKGLPVHTNYIMEGTVPNYWLSALIIDSDYMCSQIREQKTVCYTPEHGKSCPTEILNAISSINADGRPIWKPMHMQPIFKQCEIVLTDDNYDTGADIFQRGCCLPSDNKMTAEQQDKIIEVIGRCFD